MPRIPDTVHTEHGSHNGHLLVASRIAGCEQGSPQPRIKGQFCQLVAQRSSQSVGMGDSGAELVQSS